MKLNVKISAQPGSYTKYVQWGVFIAVCVALGWAFYFYYDLNGRLSEVEQSQTITETKVNETKLEQVKQSLTEREQAFQNQPATSRNPFE